ncbi:endonuclease domain-containing protein [Pseudonocardia sp. KRD291]|uniref:endonuclease domain-containing protein n=1 Tax=Pseudonocardia sp. KRD291 TaxID=2792007 RepID=UPI001C4A2FDC|nr:endonuclease domain-containing protein [Pseudonocardia sp. KRD291]MBW0103694.1 hypothetical protein [Pseudonocardia sp. KRD291]
MGVEPFRGSESIASGRVTKGALRGRGYHRLFPDIYVDASVTLTCAVWARAAYLLAATSGGVLAGYSAAELLGASCGPWSAPAEILVAGHVRGRPGLRVRRGTFAAADVGAVDGVLTTSPERTAWDLARRLDLVEAVVAVDALAAARRRRPTFVPGPVHGPDSVARSRTVSLSPGFDPAALLRRRLVTPGAPGARRLDRVVELADPRAESPPETRLRLLLVLAGLPAPDVQHRLRDERRDLDVRFDLAYPEAKLAIEYDGEDHDDALDRARDLRTAALGWHTLRLLRPDLTRTPGRTVAVIRTLRAERAELLAPTPSGT